MAKKKKTQLKPVVRGFATTSVPRRSATEEVSAVDGQTHQATGVQGDKEGHGTVDKKDPEEILLQSYVDKLQERTEKEISRALKAVEMDRRFSQSLPIFELDEALADRILELARQFDIVSDKKEGRKSLDESEDKSIARLAVTYGVLRRLGFLEDRVMECLHAIHGVELDEAYDWLYLHCTGDEINHYTSQSPELKPPGTSSLTQTVSTPSTPISTTGVPSLPHEIASVTPPPPSLPETKSYLEDNNLKERILSTCSKSASASDSGRDSPETDNPVVQYVQAKLRLRSLTQHGKLVDGSESQALRDQMEALKTNYFFNEKEAKECYEIERRKIDANALQSRLLGEIPNISTHHSLVNVSKARTPSPQTPASFTTRPDVFEDDSDELTGGIFHLLDGLTETESGTGGVTITVRDMALPKHWSGRTPKVILKETVSKVDRYAAVSYNIISSASRVKRAAVRIMWEGRKMDEWFMEDTACCDEEQAEQFIATVALHSLTFPPTEGFAATFSSGSGGQTFFRSLPPVYRVLWDELEATRKARAEATNRSVWLKLRSVLETKLQVNNKTCGRSAKPIPDLERTNNLSNPFQPTEVAREQLAAKFKARQATAEYQAMLEQRNLLPIAEYRERIIESLEHAQVLVLSGETGCGKSTQVPTFILEDQLARGNPCKIYCTEPRRISAISLAHRVSRELGEPPNAVGTSSSIVGYSIRLESNTNRSTRLAFVTNGIALRMMEGGTGQGSHGTAFDEITHIIVDEVHERTIESDFLLIVLKSLLAQRPDLRVILMSATVDAERMSDFFGGCPMLHVPGRTFPVEVQFLEDAVELSHWSISESSPYAKPRHTKFYRAKPRPNWTEETPERDDDEEDIPEVKLEKRYSPETAATINCLDERLIPYDLIMRLLECICFEDISYVTYSSAILIFMPGLAEIRRLNDMLVDHPSFGSSDAFKIYPLHSTLSSENQSAVFDIPVPGIRKIVIATNIAETGITIPDITCVIDSGKHREMRFDEKRQISRLVETFIAKSNAAQRRGRAGRVQHGLCFHLVTRLRHDSQMADNPLPEMLRLSLSDLALRIKIMKVKLGSSIEDVLSRALDPPASINVQRAISVLVEVGALTSSEDITPMGRLLSKLPTDVHLGKFLLIATIFRCLDSALTIVATLTSKSPFVNPFGFEREADRAKQSFRTENSDFLTIHNAFASWRRACNNTGYVRKFCRSNFLSHQNLQQIEELRQQLLGYLIDSSFIHVDRSYIHELNRTRYGKSRTRFVAIPSELDINSPNTALINAALAAGLFPKILAVDWTDGCMRTISNNQQAFFHPSSVNFGRKLSDLKVKHLAYFTLMHSKKLYAWETGPVDDISMVLLCGECDFKLISNSVFVDKKIKFRATPKSNIALKILRIQIGSLLTDQFRGKTLSESQISWHEVAIMALAKAKLPQERGDAVVH